MPDIQKLNVNGTDFDIDDPNDVEKDNGELAETVINYESATTPTIGSFTAFLNQFVSGTKVGQWFKNFRAGCDFLLHIGSLVNNCVTDNEALPLAAAQGKVLMDLITSSNDEFSEEITQLKSDLTESVNDLQSGITSNTTLLNGLIMVTTVNYGQTITINANADCNLGNYLSIPSAPSGYTRVLYSGKVEGSASVLNVGLNNVYVHNCSDSEKNVTPYIIAMFVKSSAVG